MSIMQHYLKEYNMIFLKINKNFKKQLQNINIRVYNEFKFRIRNNIDKLIKGKLKERK